MDEDMKTKCCEENTWDALDDLVDDLREMDTGGWSDQELHLSWDEMRERIQAYIKVHVHDKS